MSFLATAAKAALPIIAGAAGSAYGKSGPQGGQNTVQDVTKTGQVNQTQTGQTTSNQAQTQNIDTTQTGFETPESAAFRNAQFARLNAQLANKGPIYGDAQKASFLTNLNDLAGGAMENLKQNLASSGALDSGRFAQGATNIELGRAGQASNFFSQLPFLEQQAQLERFKGLSDIGGQLLATGPRGQTNKGQVTGTTTGTTNTTETGLTTSNENTKGNTQQTTQGPRFVKNLAGNLGNTIGVGAGQAIGQGQGLDNIFNLFKKPTNISNVTQTPTYVPFGGGVSGITKR